MEILHITDKKLKLTLSAEEAVRYKLDAKRLEDLGDVRQLLSSLLVGEENAAEFLSGRVLVQAYPIKSGGCELFVTRLPAVRREKVETKTPPTRKSTLTPPSSLWRFSCREDLVEALSILPSHQKEPIFRIGGDTFVLVSRELGGASGWDPLLEFASPLPSSALDLLSEHGEGVSFQALERDPRTK